MIPLSESENSQSSSAPTACTESSFLPVTAAFRKSRCLLEFTIDALLKRRGVARIVFVTLTFPEPVRSIKIAHDKLNSLLNAVRKRHGGYLWVLEAHQSGGAHYHLLIPVGFDCHTGTNLDAWRERFFHMEGMHFHSENPARRGLCTSDNYLRNSMNQTLRAESDWWQAVAKTHGFGRVQVAPIYSEAKAIRNYLIKQDWRSRPWPFEERKNVPFWRCSQNLRVGTVKFAWTSPGAREVRQRMAEWARGHGCDSEADLPIVIGPRWNLVYMCEVVWGVPPPAYASESMVGVACPYPAQRYNNPDFRWPPRPDAFADAA